MLILKFRAAKLHSLQISKMERKSHRTIWTACSLPFLKQVAYNERIMKAEEEISGINCDIADFVSQMSLDPAEEVIICVNGTHEMNKGERAMAGQLWIQGDKMMTAANPIFPGMANTKESAILSAAAEALEWRNDALESPDPPRKGQRVVIYPKELWSLEEALATGDPNAVLEDGHEIACQRYLQLQINLN
jgi:hypothetical protein